MSLTLTQLTDQVMFNAFAGVDFTTLAQRSLNEAVNELGRRLGGLKRYEVASFATTGTVTLTQPFNRIEEVWLCNGPTATTEDALVLQADRRLYPVRHDSGALVVVRAGGPFTYQTEHVPGDRPTVSLRVFPSSTSGFVGVVGRGLPPVMVNPSDTSGFGGEMDDALICFARSRCFRAEDDFQAAQVWMADFDAQVRQYAKDKTPTQDGPIVTPGSWDDGGSPVLGGW